MYPGSGIFISPQGVLLRSGSVAMSLLVWLLCGVISLLGALCYCELGTVIPMSGGEYAYYLKALGPLGRWGNVAAFLYVWATVMLTKPAALAIMVLTFARYLAEPFLGGGCDDHTGSYSITLLALLCLLTIAVINCVSVKWATKMQNIFTIAKLLAIGLVVFGGLIHTCLGNGLPITINFEGPPVSFSQIATACYFGLWAYEGCSNRDVGCYRNSANYITEELINPYVTLPRALWIGIPLVTLCYIVTNIAYLAAMTSSELLATQVVAVKFAARVLGPVSAVIPLFVAASAYGAGNANTFCTGRLVFVAGREGHMPEAFSYVNVKRLTPLVAIIFNTFLCAVMILLGNINSLIDFFSFTAWIFYGGAMALVIVLRFTMKDTPRPYKVPLVIPVLMVLICIFLVVTPIVQNPTMGYVYALIFIFSGMLFYIPFVHLKKKLPIMGEFHKSYTHKTE
ncbi:SLC7A9 [Cordylochernes scorpioides]|uniref:SLC7A9 n=1 Tax=Cordylochernes scorpioides TaxID=51811 RepID=A0ABY6LLJ4_9ARAC|nr:SLC7A9 [Cordylochernes scorpioides]